jgi:hypothetical protein
MPNHCSMILRLYGRLPKNCGSAVHQEAGAVSLAWPPTPTGGASGAARAVNTPPIPRTSPTTHRPLYMAVRHFFSPGFVRFAMLGSLSAGYTWQEKTKAPSLSSSGSASLGFPSLRF